MQQQRSSTLSPVGLEKIDVSADDGRREFADSSEVSADPASRDRPAEGRLPAPTNAMSVDVEDYFQVSAFAKTVQRSDWDTLPCRVERNVDRILQLFDEHHAKATFFTLGWVARRYPETVRRIVAEGHELASHGLEHRRVDSQEPKAFRADIREAKAILEDVGGVPVRGYRAASFSMSDATPWASRILEEEGHAYSSSLYPIRHDHYGVPDAPRFGHQPGGCTSLIELPVTTVSLFGQNLPCGGGGYFRLLPYEVSRRAMRRVNRRDREACIFYFHPWEIDPNQPRVSGISRKARFRHYTSLGRMEAKLDRLLADFSWDRMDRVFAA